MLDANLSSVLDSFPLLAEVVDKEALFEVAEKASGFDAAS